MGRDVPESLNLVLKFTQNCKIEGKEMAESVDIDLYDNIDENFDQVMCFMT